MTKEEFIEFDNSNVRRYGHYATYQCEKTKERRQMRIKNITAQYLELVDALKNEGLKFMCFEVARTSKYGNMMLMSDIVLPDFNIMIRFWDENDKISVAKKDAFYQKICKNAFPFFVERKDSLEWTLEKLGNCIAQTMTKPKKGIKTKIIREKRPRINKIKNKRYGYRIKI